MKGVHLRLYTHEDRRHGGMPLYQWLLEQGRALGIQGGSAFKAMAGYGRHGQLHEQRFFELAGEAPVLVEFIASEDQVEALLGLLDTERLPLFHARTAVDYAVTAGG